MHKDKSTNFFCRLPKYTLQKNHLFLVKQCAKMIRQHKSRISTSISKKVISYENDKLIILYNNLQNKKCQKNLDLYDNFYKTKMAWKGPRDEVDMIQTRPRVNCGKV